MTAQIVTDALVMAILWAFLISVRHSDEIIEEGRRCYEESPDLLRRLRRPFVSSVFCVPGHVEGDNRPQMAQGGH